MTTNTLTQDRPVTHDEYPCTPETIARSKAIAEKERAELARELIDRGDVAVAVRLGLPVDPVLAHASMIFEDLEALGGIVQRQGLERVCAWLASIAEVIGYVEPAGIILSPRSTGE